MSSKKCSESDGCMLKHIMSEEDVKARSYSFADDDADDEFCKIDAQRAADIADDVGRQKRKSAPGNNDRQLMFLKRRSDFDNVFPVLLFKEIANTKKFREIVNTYGGYDNARHNQEIKRQRREKEQPEYDQIRYRNERESPRASQYKEKRIAQIKRPMESALKLILEKACVEKIDVQRPEKREKPDDSNVASHDAVSH